MRQWKANLLLSDISSDQLLEASSYIPYLPASASFSAPAEDSFNPVLKIGRTNVGAWSLPI